MARSSLLLGSALAGLVLAAASPTAAQPAIDLDQLTATQAAADLCAGKITSKALPAPDEKLVARAGRASADAFEG